MGLGDDIVGSLATVLPILRNVERLVAFDNRMTDAGTHDVVKAVQGMPALTHLGESVSLRGADLGQKIRQNTRRIKDSICPVPTDHPLLLHKEPAAGCFVGLLLFG